MTLGDIYGDDAPVTKEFPFGTLKFSPLSIDYWLRLQRDHGKTLQDFVELAELDRDDVLSTLQSLQLVVAMLHAATWPYVKGKYDFEAWKNTLFGWVTAYPVLVDWFFTKYVPENLPDGGTRPKS